MGADLTDAEYADLLTFRTELRRFQRWSEEQAVAEGLTAAQHQLLLAVRGHPGARPTIGEVAGVLLLRHHSAVELADRCAAAGLVDRIGDPDDQRIARLRLTPRGRAVLRRLAPRHLEELRRVAAVIGALAPGAFDPPTLRERPS